MKKNIVLDLDNTLLSTVSKTEMLKLLEPEEELKVPLHFITYYNEDDMLIYPRPYLQEFLDFLFENYNVSIFTAAESNYAYYIINNLILSDNPNRKLDFIMTFPHYQNCLDIYIKHKYIGYITSKYPSYTEETTRIIDDNPVVWYSNPNNIIMAKPFDVVSKYIDIDTRNIVTALNKESYTDDYLLTLKNNLKSELI